MLGDRGHTRIHGYRMQLSYPPNARAGGALVAGTRAGQLAIHERLSCMNAIQYGTSFPTDGHSQCSPWVLGNQTWDEVNIPESLTGSQMFLSSTCTILRPSPVQSG
eukprot:353751-Chlamydomonas_euryale.AAC.4